VNESDLKIEAARLGVFLNPSRLAAFKAYTEMILAWSSRMNLTAVKAPEQIVTKHYADSLSLLPLIDEHAKTLIDVGTGAGFPGLPLAIAAPHIQFFLIDSLNKRVNFVREVVKQLNLKNVSCEHARAQEAAPRLDCFENFDAATARAVASMTEISKCCLPFVSPGGFFYAMKGPSALKEIAEAEATIESLGGKLKSVETVNLKGSFEGGDITHAIYAVEKIRSVPYKRKQKCKPPSKAKAP
jgi:16S rRNA (guanine527-N7)-methyltransferase